MILDENTRRGPSFAFFMRGSGDNDASPTSGNYAALI
jgi:hypothetical protein